MTTATIISLLKALVTLIDKVFSKLVFYWLGKLKRKKEEAEEDVERAKKDAEIDASGDVSGDALRDRLRNK